MIYTEDGSTETEFLAEDSTSPHVLRSRQRPGASIHDPPYHWHKFQTECFTVESGTFVATLDGEEQTFKPGQKCIIQPGRYHTFKNGSQDEDLVFLIHFTPQERDRDEAFFRNIYSYLEDCRRAGMSPSICQLCLWMLIFDCYLALPGPRKLAMWFSPWLMWFLGVVIGQGLLGMKESYPEYYAGDIKAILQNKSEEKKEL